MSFESRTERELRIVFSALFFVVLHSRLFNFVVGAAEFSFTCLLHTCVRVPDISLASVSNLHGLTLVGKVRLIILLHN